MSYSKYQWPNGDGTFCQEIVLDSPDDIRKLTETLQRIHARLGERLQGKSSSAWCRPHSQPIKWASIKFYGYSLCMTSLHNAPEAGSSLPSSVLTMCFYSESLEMHYTAAGPPYMDGIGYSRVKQDRHGRKPPPAALVQEQV